MLETFLRRVIIGVQMCTESWAVQLVAGFFDTTAAAVCSASMSTAATPPASPPPWGSMGTFHRSAGCTVASHSAGLFKPLLHTTTYYYILLHTPTYSYVPLHTTYYYTRQASSSPSRLVRLVRGAVAQV